MSVTREVLAALFMVLVAYSDSEGSDSEESIRPTVQSKPAPAAKSSNNFTVDKANPTKIRVNLSSSLPQPTNEREDGEPAAKRPRVGGGGGAFSGFNAMLPAPKRDKMKPGAAATSTNGSKPPARKVFGLKTGAEPAFSREADAEMRDFFAEQEQERAQNTSRSEAAGSIPSDIPKPQFHTEAKTSQTTSKPFMFKPLSVSRGPKKRKTASQVMKVADLLVEEPTQATNTTTTQKPSKNNTTEPEPVAKKQKISLFPSGPTELPPYPDPEPEYQDHEDDDDDEIIELLDDQTLTTSHPSNPQPQSESLTSLATSLNLTPAERRQLLGRNPNQSASHSKIIQFNTDTEYAANQELNAATDAAAVHNPVRAIAGGKHSLKQLVANAVGQREALEESFAVGRRNKREAGGRYGW